jgi:glyoxylase-like metal-dependent hydrolase (beta-lactamase superfamily II)
MSNLRIGSIDIAVISDGRLRMDPTLMFGANQPEEFRQRVQLDSGRVALSINCVLLRTGERTILLDTGAGRDIPMLVERYGGEIGQLVDNLGVLGVSPSDIDTLVISHAHGDHIGGTTIPVAGSDDVVPTFPEALYWMWAGEWAHWTTAEAMAERPFLQRKLPPLLAHGQLDLADEEMDVAPGVRLIPAPGHTPGHLCVAITSGQEMAIYTGDLLHHECQLEHPEWSPMFDLLPEMSAASRQRVLEQAHRERAVLITAHLPTPGIVRL